MGVHNDAQCHTAVKGGRILENPPRRGNQDFWTFANISGMLWVETHFCLGGCHYVHGIILTILRSHNDSATPEKVKRYNSDFWSKGEGGDIYLFSVCLLGMLTF